MRIPFLAFGTKTVLKIVALFALAACFVNCSASFSGALPFEQMDGEFKIAPRADVQAISVTCKDKKKPVQKGVPGAYRYTTTCSKDGGFPGKVIGIYKVPPVSVGSWSMYESAAKLAAAASGCPAIVIRDAAPKVEHKGEVVGAFCVDPGQPAGAGPLKIRTSLVPNEPTKVMAAKGGGKGGKKKGGGGEEPGGAQAAADGEEEETDEE
jgi:hypothetical protein